MNHRVFSILMVVLFLKTAAAGQPVAISPRVGETIDAAERRYFHLFPAAADFRSAEFTALADGRALLTITAENPSRKDKSGFDSLAIVELARRDPAYGTLLEHWDDTCGAKSFDTLDAGALATLASHIENFESLLTGRSAPDTARIARWMRFPPSSNKRERPVRLRTMTGYAAEGVLLYAGHRGVALVPSGKFFDPLHPEETLIFPVSNIAEVTEILPVESVPREKLISLFSRPAGWTFAPEGDSSEYAAALPALRRDALLPALPPELRESREWQKTVSPIRPPARAAADVPADAPPKSPPKMKRTGSRFYVQWGQVSSISGLGANLEKTFVRAGFSRTVHYPGFWIFPPSTVEYPPDTKVATEFGSVEAGYRLSDQLSIGARYEEPWTVEVSAYWQEKERVAMQTYGLGLNYYPAPLRTRHGIEPYVGGGVECRRVWVHTEMGEWISDDREHFSAISGEPLRDLQTDVWGVHLRAGIAWVLYGLLATDINLGVHIAESVTVPKQWVTYENQKTKILPAHRLTMMGWSLSGGIQLRL